jgi:membrane protein implicated in regulation of membrane protease activity
MRAPPMRPWQNAVALVAVLIAAAALLPLAPGARVTLAVLAFGTVCVLLAMRLRAHAARRDAARVSGVYDRIARIREQRAKRGR